MKKMLWIVNPHAGRGAMRGKLIDCILAFQKAGFDVTLHVTEGPEDATRVAQARAGEFDRIVCAGGDSSQYFALRVRGESMLNAGILPDDLVVVRQQQTANNGEIVVALLGDEATVKRYSRRNGQVWLLPENEAYSPIDGHDAQILGKVAAVIRRY